MFHDCWCHLRVVLIWAQPFIAQNNQFKKSSAKSSLWVFLPKFWPKTWKMTIRGNFGTFYYKMKRCRYGMTWLVSTDVVRTKLTLQDQILATLEFVLPEKMENHKIQFFKSFFLVNFGSLFSISHYQCILRKIKTPRQMFKNYMFQQFFTAALSFHGPHSSKEKQSKDDNRVLFAFQTSEDV